MPEVLHNDPADTSVHDASGAVKMQTDANDHLDRLFAADRAEIPWFVSLYQNIHDVFKPEKLPPLVLTSKPVAVKSIWGLYSPDRKSWMMSFSFVTAVVLILLYVGATNPTVQKAIEAHLNLIDPNIKPFVPQKAKGGGGGGAREIAPVSKGQLPKPSLKQFVPPSIVRNEAPKLTIDPSIIAPPDTVMPNITANNWGDPLSKFAGLSNGPGSGGGMGSGKGGGVGSGTGGGVGPGSGGGYGGGVFKVGNGVSQPAIIFKVDPEYSEEARKAKYSGTVVLSVIVDSEGKAREIKVLKSLGMGLDEKAVEAVEKWKFKPGMKAGAPVAVRAQIEVNFRLL